MPISDILRNNVKEKLARDEVVASMTVRLVRTIEIARIARTAGFDTLYVDLEHSSFSLETCGEICIAALEAGIAPFVRVPANTPDYIARVARRRRARHHRPARPFGGRGEGGGEGGQISAAGRALERERPAAPALPRLPGGRGLRRAQRRHHGDRAVRERGGARARRGDRRGRRRRHGAGRPQRPAGRLGHSRPVRPPARARGLCPHHRGLPPARQALRRRRARHPPRPGGRVRADGRALRLDRHRPGASSGRAPAAPKQVREIEV